MAMDPRKIKGKYHLFFSEVATSENSRDVVNFTRSHGGFSFLLSCGFILPLKHLSHGFQSDSQLKDRTNNGKETKKK